MICLFFFFTSDTTAKVETAHTGGKKLLKDVYL